MYHEIGCLSNPNGGPERPSEPNQLTPLMCSLSPLANRCAPTAATWKVSVPSARFHGGSDGRGGGGGSDGECAGQPTSRPQPGHSGCMHVHLLQKAEQPYSWQRLSPSPHIMDWIGSALRMSTAITTRLIRHISTLCATCPLNVKGATTPKCNSRPSVAGPTGACNVVIKYISIRCPAQKSSQVFLWVVRRFIQKHRGSRGQVEPGHTQTEEVGTHARDTRRHTDQTGHTPEKNRVRG